MRQILVLTIAVGLSACAQAPEKSQGFGGGWVLYPPVSRGAVEDPHADLCPPAGVNRKQLETLKAAGFEIADAIARENFALAMTNCLGNPDPWLRDSVAYEALAHMLRNQQLGDEAKRLLMNTLVAQLGTPDSQGFRQPFAALALSEVARADRIEAFLTGEERAELLVEAQHWFINISDYRGFSDTEGWRHAVAHGSDLLMQLALNPKIDEEGLRVIVSAVGMQVAPAGHAYVDGESERLARPVLYAASRGVMSEQEWTEWFGALAKPRDADAVFASKVGLAWRHDVMAFLQSLYVNVVIGSDPKDDVMRPGLEAALKALP